MTNVHNLEDYRRKKEREKRKRQKDLARWRRLGRQVKRSGHPLQPKQSWMPLAVLFGVVLVTAILIQFIF